VERAEVRDPGLEDVFLQLTGRGLAAGEAQSPRSGGPGTRGAR